MFLFFIYKQRYKSKKINKNKKKMSAENGQMGDLSSFVGKRQYLITYAQDIIDKFPTTVNFDETIEE